MTILLNQEKLKLVELNPHKSELRLLLTNLRTSPPMLGMWPSSGNLRRGSSVHPVNPLETLENPFTFTALEEPCNSFLNTIKS